VTPKGAVRQYGGLSWRQLGFLSITAIYQFDSFKTMTTVHVYEEVLQSVFLVYDLIVLEQQQWPKLTDTTLRLNGIE